MNFYEAQVDRDHYVRVLRTANPMTAMILVTDREDRVIASPIPTSVLDFDAYRVRNWPRPDVEDVASWHALAERQIDEEFRAKRGTVAKP